MARRGENIYKRKDGRWEGRYQVYCSEMQKMKYKSVYAHSYKECKEKLKAVSKKPEPISTLKNISIEEIFQLWLEYINGNVKKSTYYIYFNIVNKHILPYMKNKKISEINNIYIENFKKYKLKKGRLDKKGGLSPKTVCDILAVLKAVIKYSSNNLGISFNVNLDLISTSVKNKKQKEVISLNEQEILENYLDNNVDNYSCAIKLSLYTGLRLGEVCGLQKKDFDFLNNTFTVCKTVQRIKQIGNGNKTCLTTVNPKTVNSERTLPIPEKIIPLIKELLKCKKEEDFIFSNKNNKPLDPRTLQYYFVKVIKNCNLKNYSFHTLRHTFATRFVERGFDIKTLSEILGHSNVNITLSTYVHSSFEMKRKYMNELNYKPSENVV